MAATNNSRDHSQQRQSRILIMGSCGMDRLLTVPKYPNPEDKVRTISVVDVGGGNAANVAHTTALLLQDDLSINDDDDCGEDSSTTVRCPQVQLCTKVGADTVGVVVKNELCHAGVDLDGSSLFKSVPETTTGYTTVIVGQDDHTRTCIHTPGTCGEWDQDEIATMVKDNKFWRDVCHFHSDARHTDAALLMAHEAKRRGIPISLDVEKDRGTNALDELLVVSDIIFTNALQLEAYLSKLNQQAEQKLGKLPLDVPEILVEDENDNGMSLDPTDDLLKDLVYALRPSTYFTRWFAQEGKQVVITKGNKGSIHVVCKSVSVEADSSSDDTKSPHEVRLSLLQSDHDDESDGESVIVAKQRFVDRTSSSVSHDKDKMHNNIVSAVYEIKIVGIWPDVTSVVDTTGCGDSFLGGYLSSMWWARSHGYEATVHDCLRLGTWVAAKKIEGPGSRTTLPTREQRDTDLGPTPNLAFSQLRKKIGPFCGKSLTVTKNKATSK